MGEQAVHAIFGDGKLGVVVIIGVDKGAIGECGKTRRQECLAANDGAAGAAGDAKCIEIAQNDATSLRRGARECESEPIEDRALAETGTVGLSGVGISA